MAQTHFLDIKIPLGWLLTFYGVVLTTYGLLSKSEVYQKSAHINVNLIWGGMILVIGIILLSASCCCSKNKKKRAL